jgi:hypothetical protein
LGDANDQLRDHAARCRTSIADKFEDVRRGIAILVASTWSWATPLTAGAVQQPAPDEAPVESEPTPPPPIEPPPTEAPPVEAPVEAPPVDAPPPSVSTSPGDPSYEELSASLPADYDIDYRWVPPDKHPHRDKAERTSTTGDHQISSKGATRMRLAGGTLLGLGIATAVLSVSIGVPVGLSSHGDTADNGKLAAIAGGATGAAAALIGTGLLVGGRKAARKNGDLPERVPGDKTLTTKQRSNHIVAAIVGTLYGVGGVGGGIGLMLGSSSESKQNGGKVLLALGSISLAIGTYAAIRLGVDKVRRTSTTRIQGGPMFVRGGGGGSLSLRF